MDRKNPLTMHPDDDNAFFIPEETLQKATEAVHNWLISYTLPANYTLDRQFNESVAEANSESLARAALQAALNTVMFPEWGILRKTAPVDAIPLENMRFTTREIAQQYLNKAYTTPDNWEVRGRVVGGWTK